MTDSADVATENMEREEQARAARRRAMELIRPPVSARECVDCGDPIDPRRRAAQPGCQRCVECEADFERQRAVRYGV